VDIFAEGPCAECTDGIWWRPQAAPSSCPDGPSSPRASAGTPPDLFLQPNPDYGHGRIFQFHDEFMPAVASSSPADRHPTNLDRLGRDCPGEHRVPTYTDRPAFVSHPDRESRHGLTTPSRCRCSQPHISGSAPPSQDCGFIGSSLLVEA
jgi:hypothetical protein